MAEVPSVEMVNPEGKVCPQEMKKQQHLMQVNALCAHYFEPVIKGRKERN